MKLLIRSLLVLVVLTQSFVVRHLIPASAQSDSVVLYQIQTAGAVSGTASQELIVLLNTSLTDVNVTNWCIQYSSSADSLGFKKCLVPIDAQTEIWLSSGGLVSFATAEFVTANPSYVPDIVFTAGMAATGGHIRLFNSAGSEVDKVGWGTAISPEGVSAVVHETGKILGRSLSTPVTDTDNNMMDFSTQERLTVITSGLYEIVVPVDVCPNIDGLQTVLPDGYMLDQLSQCQFDICPNIDELQTVLPVGYELQSGLCTLIPLESRPILITEVYPNALSYDTGLEFIELYNPNDSDISLEGYTLEVGPDYIRSKQFGNEIIASHGYLSFSDTATGIVLPNSSGVSLRLRNQAGGIVSESPVYSSIAESTSWAIVEDTWIMTNQVTPAATNKPYLQVADDEVLGVTTVLAPCPLGKYRNPETNRCRTIETAVSTLVPCDEDEYRNPDTNRCRKVVSTASTLKACEEGEERNPETNRCRKITSIEAKTVDELPVIDDVAVTQKEGTFNWQVTSLALLGTTGYILYEWRNELMRKFKLRGRN